MTTKTKTVLIPAAAGFGQLLDVACASGRSSRNGHL
jgi:hypothetical protein